MRKIFIFLGLLLIISLAIWQLDAQDDPTTTGVTEQVTLTSTPTEQATLTSTPTDPATEIPSDGNLDTPVFVPTIEPTDLQFSPATYTLAPTDMPTSTDTETPYPIITASPTEEALGVIPTAEFVETQTIDLTEVPAYTFTLTPTDMATVEITSTNQSPVMTVACDLDIDQDGAVTDHDLSKIGKDLLNSVVNETTSKFDLNANLQIDIGDLQKMTIYLAMTCSK